MTEIDNCKSLAKPGYEGGGFNILPMQGKLTVNILTKKDEPALRLDLESFGIIHGVERLQPLEDGEQQGFVLEFVPGVRKEDVFECLIPMVSNVKPEQENPFDV